MPGPPQWFGAKLADAVRGGRRRREAPRRHGAPRADDPRSHRVRSTRPIRSRSCPRSPSTTRSTATSPGAPRPGASCCCRTATPRSRSTGVRTLAVVGPNADIAHVMGGGSARVPTHPLVSPLVGLRARFGADVEIVHERGCTNNKITPPLDTRFLDGAIEVAYYAGPRARRRSRARRGLRTRVLHVDGSGRRRRARRLLGPVARDAGPAGVRRVEVQRRAGRPRAGAARRRDVRSTTGTRRNGARPSTGWAAPSWRRPSISTAGPPLRARRRGDPRRARAGRPVGRARAAGGRRPDRSGRDGGAAPRTRSCASSAPTGSGRPRATTASR